MSKVKKEKIVKATFDKIPKTIAVLEDWTILYMIYVKRI